MQDFDKKQDLKNEVTKQLLKLEVDCKDALTILDTMKPGDDPTAHYKLQDLLSGIKTSKPKVQKSLEEESSDEAKLGAPLFPSSFSLLFFELFVRNPSQSSCSS